MAFWSFFAALVAMPMRASADDSRSTVPCGGVRMSYGMSIGVAGPDAHTLSTSGVMALAAVTTKDLRARAWIAWDERAQPWLAVTQKSPADLKGLWVSKNGPDFSGPGVQVRWTYLAKRLPRNYRLTDCPDALPYN